MTSPSSSALRCRTDTSLDLPRELIEDILLRCPVKSVVRFKSVLKSWQSIISEPRFARIHCIRRSKLSENENKFVILARKEVLDAHIYLIRWDEEDGVFRTESVFPYPSPIFNIPFCSCDGLILLGQIGNNQHYMLWNPSIGKHIIITVPHAAPRRWLHHFYYDSTTEDHKIVFSNKKGYTVYSCKKGEWSEMKDFPSECICLGVFVDGCFFRLGNGGIVCFDTRDGNLHKFRQPNGVSKHAVSLMEESGRLYFYGYMKDDDEKCHKWAMEKHGCLNKWVKEKNTRLRKWNTSGYWMKLINMDKEVADLRFTTVLGLAVWTKQVTDIPRFTKGKRELGIFPYSENLYMPCSNTLAP